MDILEPANPGAMDLLEYTNPGVVDLSKPTNLESAFPKDPQLLFSATAEPHNSSKAELHVGSADPWTCAEA